MSVTGNSKEYLQSLTGSYSINHLIPTDHATDPPHKTRNTGKRIDIYMVDINLVMDIITVVEIMLHKILLSKTYIQDKM